MPSHDKVLNALVNVKRHVRGCRQCHLSRKSGVVGDMCEDGLRFMSDAMHILDEVIALRLKAYAMSDPYVIPCPDPSKHGDTYAMTAIPVAVTGFQDRLF